jgi:hypothetical protein
VNTVHEQTALARKSRRHRIWVWIGGAVLVLGITALVTIQVLIRRAEPILRQRVTQALSKQLDSRVELGQLNVSVLNGLNVSGNDLRVFPNNPDIVSKTKEPLIAIKRFEFHTRVSDLFQRPIHVGIVTVQGMAITIPPKRERKVSAPRRLGMPQFVLDEMVCDDSYLLIENANPNKDPRLFQLKHIVLHGVGRDDAPWDYDAILTNAIPPGEIHATGTFGPWSTESPGDSNVTGKYIFENANLDAIRGIGGMLHSRGSFQGQLNRIDIQGAVDVPNFSLDTPNRPLPLSTTYTATVDGTSGDTYLHAVNATLLHSAFTCSGSIVNEKGKGHIIDIDVDVPSGRIQDFLALAVKAQPSAMTGSIQTKAKLHIRPGKERVTEKLTMKGSFALHQIHFTNPEIEDKVDMMSLRAQGKPHDAKPGAPDVHSQMTGHFDTQAGKMRFSELDYELPGASVTLAGLYALDGGHFDFTGHVKTKAGISHMVDSIWKSILLKPIDPFFRKDGAGADIPVEISGTGDKPHVGLKLGGR